jgi:hypothetical protein
MRDFVEFGGNLGEFEPRVLRPGHPGAFEARVAGMRTQLGQHLWHVSNLFDVVQ